MIPTAEADYLLPLLFLFLQRPQTMVKKTRKPRRPTFKYFVVSNSEPAVSNP